jgi:hypothetical protein
MDGISITSVLTVMMAMLVAACGWRYAGRRKKRKGTRPPSKLRPNADLRTKRKLDTALRELRDLREALPPAEKIRVERRKSGSAGLQGRAERRKGRGPR